MTSINKDHSPGEEFYYYEDDAVLKVLILDSYGDLSFERYSTEVLEVIKQPSITNNLATNFKIIVFVNEDW
jgi:hypothetical protein